MAPGNKCLFITIRGVVQGVGFRPFIYNLARELGIRGFVSNTSSGVIIHAEGPELEGFLHRIRHDAPPLARIDQVDVSPADPSGFADFSIRDSDDDGSFTLLSPDISTCSDCLRELRSPDDRRFGYPFINCTNCGPRYSITRAVPYDRQNTTMSLFTLCKECAEEYHDPGNRRFHAQPNACPDCGPRVSLLDAEGVPIDSADPMQEARQLLSDGKILAVKGLGGFQIACDALNDSTVEMLRQRKRKSNKPFAVMTPEVALIKECCEVSPDEEALLVSAQRPIVLLRKRSAEILSGAVAPGNASIGFMLPYTPLHYLLFTGDENQASRWSLRALVMTSGNLSEEPIVRTNEEAVEKLSRIVDAFLVHDREIFMRVDDSVLRTMYRPLPAAQGAVAVTSFVRRSRGYAPEAIPLLEDGPVVLGCGADVKNTFALTRGRYAILSQHIGDMENYETLQFFEETFRNLSAVYRAVPQLVISDLHPGYLSVSWAREYARAQGLPVLGIQHHYAHIGSVIAEHGLTGNIVGVAFDGTGYGPDGALWGGEFLIANSRGFRRAGHLKYVPMPGGEAAIREPWRMAVSFLADAFGTDDFLHDISPTGLVDRCGGGRIEDVLKVSGRRAFSPLSSGAGRLFDAVSAIVGLCTNSTFEGEASMALESIVAGGISDAYPADIHFGDGVEVDFSFALRSMVTDLRNGVDRQVIAARFHNAVAEAVVRVVHNLAFVNNITMVALSGGVFQNRYLTEKVVGSLQEEGLSVYLNEQVPCNDAGIALGQAYLGREMMKAGLAG